MVTLAKCQSSGSWKQVQTIRRHPEFLISRTIFLSVTFAGKLSLQKARSRFSRPPDSTTLAPHRILIRNCSSARWAQNCFAGETAVRALHHRFRVVDLAVTATRRRIHIPGQPYGQPLQILLPMWSKRTRVGIDAMPPVLRN